MTQKIRETLELFLGKKENRSHVCNIFQEGNYAYAMDGYIAVRFKTDIGIDLGIHAPDVTKIPFEKPDDAVKLEIDLDNFTEFAAEYKCKHCTEDKYKVTSEPCEECDGEGSLVVSGDFNEYEVECKSCDGNGYTPGIRLTSDCTCIHGYGTALPFPFGVGYIQVNRLARALKIPDVEFYHLEDKFMYLFQGGGYEGLMMADKG